MTMELVDALIDHWDRERLFCAIWDSIDEDHRIAEYKLAYYERLKVQLEREERDNYDD